jgi:hypothetical protein
MWEKAVGNALALSKGRDHKIWAFYLDCIMVIGSNQIISEPVLHEQSAHYLLARFRRQH